MFLDNYELLDNEERNELLGWLFMKNIATHEEAVFKQTIDKQVDDIKEFEQRLFLAQRHNLNYAKLYMDYQGGYDMDRLKEAMQNMKKDAEKGVI